MSRDSRELRDLAVLAGRFLKPYRGRYFVLVLVSLAAGVAAATQNLVLAPALDAALGAATAPAATLKDLSLDNLGATLRAAWWPAATSGPLAVMAFTLIAYLGVLLVSSALGLISLTLALWVRGALTADVQAALFEHVVRLPPRFFARRRTGELMHRLRGDAIQVVEGFDLVARGVLESLLQIALYTVILLRTDLVLAAAVGGVGLAQLAALAAVRKQVRDRARAAADANADVSSLLQEALTGIGVVKAFAAEGFELSRLRQRLAVVRQATQRHALGLYAAPAVRDLGIALAAATAFLCSFSALDEGRLTLSGFILFLLVARQAMVPIAALNGQLAQAQAVLGASHAVRALFDEQPAADGLLPAGPLRTGLRFEKVSYAYEPGTRVLHGVDIFVPAGSMVALVGPSGAGKSTLLELALRLRDPDEGRVTWDGIDLRELQVASYRRRLGTVSQDTLLFSGTLEDNVACGRPLDRGELARAAGLANAADFVARLADGWRTRVGERGLRLSGGERQRIAIARALYGRPDLLLLDEATSALDGEAERLVQQALESAVTGVSAIVVAHRLSTVMRADEIVVLDGGAVVGQGSHRELLERCSVYQRLYAAGFGQAGETAGAA